MKEDWDFPKIWSGEGGKSGVVGRRHLICNQNYDISERDRNPISNWSGHQHKPVSFWKSDYHHQKELRVFHLIQLIWT